MFAELSQPLVRVASAAAALASARHTDFRAHELRNPLAPLRSCLQVLRLSAGDPAAATRVLDVTERQLGHMVELVDDLFDIARITRGQLELKPVLIDLQGLASAPMPPASTST